MLKSLQPKPQSDVFLAVNVNVQYIDWRLKVCLHHIFKDGYIICTKIAAAVYCAALPNNTVYIQYAMPCIGVVVIMMEIE